MRDRGAVSTIQPRGRIASRRSSARALRTTYPNRTIHNQRARACRQRFAEFALHCNRRTAATVQCKAQQCHSSGAQTLFVPKRRRGRGQRAALARDSTESNSALDTAAHCTATAAQRPQCNAKRSSTTLCGTNIVRPQAAPRARAARSPRQRRHREVTARLNPQDHQRSIKEPLAVGAMRDSGAVSTIQPRGRLASSSPLRALRTTYSN